MLNLSMKFAEYTGRYSVSDLSRLDLLIADFYALNQIQYLINSNKVENADYYKSFINDAIEVNKNALFTSLSRYLSFLIVRRLGFPLWNGQYSGYMDFYEEVLGDNFLNEVKSFYGDILSRYGNGFIYENGNIDSFLLSHADDVKTFFHNNGHPRDVLWQDIIDAYIYLKSRGATVDTIDNVVDLVHNKGHILTKGGDSVSDSLEEIVQRKADIISNQENIDNFLPYVSNSIKKLINNILRHVQEDSVEDADLEYIGMGRYLTPDGRVVTKSNKQAYMELSDRELNEILDILDEYHVFDITDKEWNEIVATYVMEDRQGFEDFIETYFGDGNTGDWQDYYVPERKKVSPEQNYNFAPVSPNTDIIYGSNSPHKSGDINGWYDFMKSQGIQRVVILLEMGKIKEIEEKYGFNILDKHRQEFGDENVLWVPVKDFSYINRDEFFNKIYPFLEDSVGNGIKTVVHCSAGMGRTGHVLLAWLVHHEGMSEQDAEIAMNSGEGFRNPYEAFNRKELNTLLEKRTNINSLAMVDTDIEILDIINRNFMDLL